MIEGIEESRAPFNTQIEMYIYKPCKNLLSHNYFLIKLKCFLHHYQEITPPHFWWAETRGPLLAMETMPSPRFTPLLYPLRPPRLACLFPHSSAWNSLPGTSVKLGAALSFLQEKYLILLSETVVLYLSNLSVLILWLPIFTWLGFALHIGNYQL